MDDGLLPTWGSFTAHIEPSLKWKKSLYITLIYFRNASDSPESDNIWALMGHDALLEKFITLSIPFMQSSSQWTSTSTFYNCHWCQTRLPAGGGLDHKRTTEGQQSGIHWMMRSQLEDLYFADGIAWILPTSPHMQPKTNLQVTKLDKTGFIININKTQEMHINNSSDYTIRLKCAKSSPVFEVL